MYWVNNDYIVIASMLYIIKLQTTRGQSQIFYIYIKVAYLKSKRIISLKIQYILVRQKAALGKQPDDLSQIITCLKQYSILIVFHAKGIHRVLVSQINGLVQDRSIPIANALKVPQACNKRLKCPSCMPMVCSYKLSASTIDAMASRALIDNSFI